MTNRTLHNQNMLFGQCFVVLTLMLSLCDFSADPSVKCNVSIAGTKVATSALTWADMRTLTNAQTWKAGHTPQDILLLKALTESSMTSASVRSSNTPMTSATMSVF